MALTKRSDLIYTDQLVDAVSAEFAGKLALAGTEAVITNYSLPGDSRGGDTIRVPYFDSIGELEDVAEGVALTPVKLTESSETATVQRSGKAAEITKWAQLTAQNADPYAELSKQIVKAAIRRVDSGLIAKAVATPTVLDNSGVAFTPDMLIDLVQLLGDEQDDMALWVMNSQIVTSLRKIKTSGSGEYLIQQPIGLNTLPTLWGRPIKVSDRMTATANVFSTLAVKRGALAAWINDTPHIETDKDILTDSDLQALNMYWVAHMYKRTPGGTTGGVAKLLSLK